MHPKRARRIVTMVRNEDEPVAVAIARWCEAHPAEPPPVDDDNIIMRVIVDPEHQAQRKANAKFEAVLARVLAARARQ